MTIRIRGIEDRLAVPSIIAREALYRLKDHLVWPRIANTTFDEYFEGKVGDTISIKRPYRAKVQKGRRLRKSPMIDMTIDLNLDQRWHFALDYIDETAKLDIVDFGNRYMDAGVEELAYQYDIAGAEEIANAAFHMNGTPGTALDLDDGQYIRAHATKLAIPRVRRNYGVLDPLDVAKLGADVQKVDMPEMVGKAIRETYQGRYGSWNIMDSVHVPYLETEALPAGAAPLVNGANQRGTSLTTDGWTNLGRKCLSKGQLIQIAGVMEIQPRGNRRVTGNVQTFVVTADVTPTATGAAEIPIYPNINAGTTDDVVANPESIDPDVDPGNLDASAFQTVDSIPADNAVITVVGRATTKKRYRQGIYFCGDALEYVGVTLNEFVSAPEQGVERDPETGCVISYVADFDITEMAETRRVDTFFGVKTVYPELVIRHIGAAV